MTLWQRFTFWLYRKRYDGVPSRKEVDWALCTYAMHMGRHVENAMIAYSIGLDIDDIAWTMNVPRERIRQLILKGCRLARKFNAL